MTKARELRDMADDQIRLVWKDAAESLFRLRLQAQTEKLASPTEVRKHRRTIARCQTILAERTSLAACARQSLAESARQGNEAGAV
jgi:large subunit ribosomal protein L29